MEFITEINLPCHFGMLRNLNPLIKSCPSSLACQISCLTSHVLRLLLKMKKKYNYNFLLRKLLRGGFSGYSIKNFGFSPHDPYAIARQVKRSIDARGRQVKVNVTAEVFIKQPPTPFNFSQSISKYQKC